jgi:hypothetical protein
LFSFVSFAEDRQAADIAMIALIGLAKTKGQAKEPG